MARQKIKVIKIKKKKYARKKPQKRCKSCGRFQ